MFRYPWLLLATGREGVIDDLRPKPMNYCRTSHSHDTTTPVIRLVGTRNWDGGPLTAPNAFRNLTGAIVVKNKDVAHDVESWNDPAAERQGHDPHLEKPIAVAPQIPHSK